MNGISDYSLYYPPLAQLSYFHWEPSLGNWVVSPVKGGVVRPLHFSHFFSSSSSPKKNSFPPLSTGHYPPLLLRFPPCFSRYTPTTAILLTVPHSHGPGLPIPPPNFKIRQISASTISQLPTIKFSHYKFFSRFWCFFPDQEP